MSALVTLCQSLSAVASPCQLLSTLIVSLCHTLSALVCPCRHLSAFVNPCQRFFQRYCKRGRRGRGSINATRRPGAGGGGPIMQRGGPEPGVGFQLCNEAARSRGWGSNYATRRPGAGGEDTREEGGGGGGGRRRRKQQTEKTEPSPGGEEQNQEGPTTMD